MLKNHASLLTTKSLLSSDKILIKEGGNRNTQRENLTQQKTGDFQSGIFQSRIIKRNSLLLGMLIRQVCG